MQIGVITVDGQRVGVVTLDSGPVADPFVPDLNGYEPEGRAADSTLGGPSSDHARAGHHARHGGGHSPAEKHAGHAETAEEHKHDSIRYGHHHGPGEHAPKGESYQGGRGAPFRQGSAETDQAIQDAAKAHNLDANTMRAIASIESSMNPSSNATRPTQYKGLYQVGRDEWRRFGDNGNIYSARDNAMGAARMFDANRAGFHKHFGRDPTDTELYMMHQQGLGFYTRGAMTNIGGNPYPGMHGPQTHESFEAGWGRELARRKEGFGKSHDATPAPPARSPPARGDFPDKPFKMANVQPTEDTAPDFNPVLEERKYGAPGDDKLDYDPDDAPKPVVPPSQFDETGKNVG